MQWSKQSYIFIPGNFVFRSFWFIQATSISISDKSFDLTVAITKYNNSRGYLLSLEIRKHISHHWTLSSPE